MNPDDSQITALLDDELDPGDRTAVAWAVEASSPAAQHLADLQSTRSLIRDLDRPAIPVDLSAGILAEIALAARPRSRPRRPRLVVARLAASLVGVASVAASLMFAVILLHKALHETPQPAMALNGATPPRTYLITNSPDPAPQPMSPVVAVADSQLPDSSLGRSRSQVQRSRKLAGEMDLANAPAPAAAAAPSRPVSVLIAADPEPARPEEVDAILANRKVYRALIVTEAPDRDARQVRDLVERDPSRQPEFGRIALPAGLVVDPDQPGEAEVYSVVVDRDEVGPFLDRIRKVFPRMAVDAEPEPGLVTQLGEVGRATLFGDDEGPARMGIPPATIRRAEVATKVGGHPEDYVTVAPQAEPARVARGDFDQLHRDQPARGPRTPDRAEAPIAAGLAKAKTDDEPVTVLIWVARATR